MFSQELSIHPLYLTHEEEDASIQRAHPLKIDAGSAFSEQFQSVDFRVFATRTVNGHIAALIQRPQENDFHLFVQTSLEAPWQPILYFGEVIIKPGPTIFDIKVYVRVVPTEEERILMVIEDDELQRWAIDVAQTLREAGDMKMVDAAMERWFGMLRGFEEQAHGGPMEKLHAQAVGWLSAVHLHPNLKVRGWLPVWLILLSAWQEMPEKGRWDHLAALHMVNQALHLMLEEGLERDE